MIIIAGAGHPKTEKYITIKRFNCQHCHNNSYWILEKTRYFVSLFFMPVVPYKTVYRYYCSICGNMVELSKEEFERKQKLETKPYSG